MDSVINDPNMVKHICSFLDYDDKKEFTLISKVIYNTSKLVYHDFIYDIKYFVSMSYDYKLERVRKIDNYNGEIIDSKILENIHAIKCHRDIKQNDIKLLGNLHTLNLSNTDIKDASMLGNVHTLELKCCDNITDVSSVDFIYSFVKVVIMEINFINKK